MGVSTNGQICFGLSFEEGTEFPWSDNEDGGDERSWWREVNGYKPPFEVYDAKGEYLPTIALTKDQYGRREPADKTLLDRYYRAGREWDAAHPLPFVLVNSCSGEYPQWIMAVPGTEMTARRGYPEAFEPSELAVAPESVENLLAFCRTHGIEIPKEGPKWWLSSYYSC